MLYILLIIAKDISVSVILTRRVLDVEVKQRELFSLSYLSSV